MLRMTLSVNQMPWLVKQARNQALSSRVKTVEAGLDHNGETCFSFAYVRRCDPICSRDKY